MLPRPSMQLKTGWLGAYKDGIVTVNGMVPDAAQLDEVTLIVKDVQGVVSVVNRLTVQRPMSQ